MAQIGHEAPLLDNTNPADMTPHADEAQLRVGQEADEPQKPQPETPPGLRLSKKEEDRVARLIDQGYDRGTAVVYSVSAAKARRIVGYDLAKAQVAEQERAIAKRKADQARPQPTEEELIKLYRDTLPGSNDETQEPSN